MRKARKKKRSAVVLDLVLACALAWAGLAWSQRAWASDATLDVSQYAHTAWRIRDGFTKSAIFAIAQTPDGYLWLGTDFGLYRFDGMRAVSWQPPNGERLPDNHIGTLLVARDGALWIGTLKGLANWKDGKLVEYPEAAGQILSLLQDREGTIWVGTAPNGLCAIQGGKVQCQRGKFGQFVSALYEDSTSNLWVSAESGLWRWKPGHPESYPWPDQVAADALIEGDRGALLLATKNGLKQLTRGRIQNCALPGVTGQLRPDRFFRSSDGSLWIGSFQGLLHLHQGRTDIFGPAAGLSAGVINSIFEDRESNVWVGTIDGLDRFREYAVPTISRNQGLSTSYSDAVQATADGTIWISTLGWVDRWQDGNVTAYGEQDSPGQSWQENEQGLRVSGRVMRFAKSGLTGSPRSLGLDRQGRLWVSTSDGVFCYEAGRFIRVRGVPGDKVWSIVADGLGKQWISHDTAGLLHIAPGDKVERFPWSQLGHTGYGARTLLPEQGGVWLGFYEGGISYFKDGQVHASYGSSDGLGNGRINQLRFGSLGGLWASTEGGLSRIEDGHIETLSSKNGLPCDEVHWSMEDDDHDVWVYMPCGLARIAASEWHAWVSNPRRPLQTTIYDTTDGVRNIGVYGSDGPHVTKTPDGKIWFAQKDGVSMIDPRHLPYNKVPPPVHVEQITADHKTYDLAAYGNGRVPLPARTRDLEIDYTALSLAVPEKVRFRYKLEGRDRDWQDAGNRRQAFYSDLPPRNYRFRVAACNNSGVWNEEGASLDFSIAPAYYQTKWFRALCVTAGLALVWAFYYLRLHQLQLRFNAGLEARVNERTRIARELHDTLLQNLHGLLFRFQAARNMLPRRPEEAMEALDGAIARTEQAITESQDTITDLRPGSDTESDLAELVRAAGKELETAANGNGASPSFRVIVEGERRTLSPILQAEVYRIAHELLRNSFRHACARRIEAEVRYGDEQLRVRIRDDGKGMDPEVLKKGRRPGHWGLLGVKERAEQIGAKLDFWSEPGAGTEVQLSTPAAIAYKNSHGRPRFKFLRRVKVDD